MKKRHDEHLRIRKAIEDFRKEVEGILEVPIAISMLTLPMKHSNYFAKSYYGAAEIAGIMAMALGEEAEAKTSEKGKHYWVVDAYKVASSTSYAIWCDPPTET